MQRLGVPADQGQAFCRPGHQHGLPPRGFQRNAAGTIGLGVMIGGNPRRGANLQFVRCQHGRAVIGREVGPLRIRDHPSSRRLRPRQDRIQNAVAQHTLGIIGQHDHVGPIDMGLDRRHHRCRSRRVQGVGDFFVQPQKLMRSGHKAGLRRRRAARDGDQRRFDSRR